MSKSFNPRLKARLRALLGISLLCSVGGAKPARAYEEDTHFTVTYVLCRTVGLTDEESLTVARYDQGMDDSTGTVANGGPLGAVPHPEEERLWHAIPDDGAAPTVLQRKDELWQQVVGEADPGTQLKRLGVFFHYQQDTWAHRHHPNQNATDFEPYKTPIGHALDGHQPDRPPFDPVCALRCLEDGLTYARNFMTTCLHRTPNALFDGYDPASGEQDENWADGRKGKYFHQLVSDPSTPAHQFTTDLIRAQIDAYASSTDFNPNFFGYKTADQAKYDVMRQHLQAVCDLHQLGITIPTTRDPLTTLTTAAILNGTL